jgi:hypothetical protein
MTKWRWYAAREFPRVVRELGLPAATGNYTRPTCPLHHEPVGTVTRLCESCFREAWDEVGRRYATASQGAGRKENPMNTDPLEVDVTIDEGEVSAQLDLYEPRSGTSLFLTNDPETFLKRASEAATVLARVIRERKLYTTIRGKDYVHVEGWTFVGSMLGVFPFTEWTRPIDDGWEARVIARTRAGELVGAAESMCLRKEAKWRNADEYAVRSMAATRATSKALRLPLGFVVELSGFNPTPAEEVIVEATASAVQPPRVTMLQLQQMQALYRRLADAAPNVNWSERCAEVAGAPSADLTKAKAEAVIEQMEAWAAEFKGGKVA